MRIKKFRKQNISSESNYAPASRENFSVIKNQRKEIEKSGLLNKVLSEVPMMFMILNDKRQAIYANPELISTLSYESIQQTIGLRPGEIFGCVNSTLEEGGCGTSKNCRYCGAVNAILESQISNETVTKEMRITYNDKAGKLISGEYSVTSKPFTWANQKNYLLIFNDISEIKRKEQLEKIFFHDLTNKAGSIAGLLEIINRQSAPEQSDKMINLIRRGMNELLNDIQFQKQFQQAEKGELVIRPEAIDCLKLMKNLAEDFQATTKKKNILIHIEKNGSVPVIHSDKVILNRILTNIIKNAIEASSEGETIRFCVNLKKKKCVFSVHNPAVMSEEVRSQVFQRSFSTKGYGRGIGTYSIRLFTEKYLRGKTWFISEAKQGTAFFVELAI